MDDLVKSARTALTRAELPGMSLIEHLEELRKRVIVLALVRLSAQLNGQRQAHRPFTHLSSLVVLDYERERLLLHPGPTLIAAEEVALA
jgi:hypothetical protein